MADDEALNAGDGADLLRNEWWSGPEAAGDSVMEPSRDIRAMERGTVVNYVFPVEVVLVGSLPPRERETLRAEVWQELQDAVNRRLA